MPGPRGALIDDAKAAGSVRLFSIREEFPSEWAKFNAHTPQANQRFKLELGLQPEHYPFWSKDRLKRVERIDLFAQSGKQSIAVFATPNKNDVGVKPDLLEKNVGPGDLLAGKFSNIGLPAAPTGSISLFFDEREINDLWIAVTWAGSSKIESCRTQQPYDDMPWVGLRRTCLSDRCRSRWPAAFSRGGEPFAPTYALLRSVSAHAQHTEYSKSLKEKADRRNPS